MRDLPPDALASALKTRHQLRKLLHGVILKAISQQVWVRQDDGSHARYGIAVWKRWFKDFYLGGGSTEDLTDDEFRTFVWLVESAGATAMGVTYPEQEK